MVADIAELVEAIRDELNAPNANVILWGTGFGASLATWARREYPNLIQGANLIKEKKISLKNSHDNAIFQVSGHQVEDSNKIF